MKTKKWIFYLAMPVLVVLFILPFLGAKADQNLILQERALFGPIFYAVALFFSVVILVLYLIVIKRKYVWVLLCFCSVCIANVGYLALSLANNVTEALLANRVSYFGNVYMLLFLLITINNACGIRLQRSIVILLFSVSTMMFLFTATQGYLNLFYDQVDFAIVDGYAKTIKNYGPMHDLYMIYILCYLAIVIGLVIYAVVKKKTYSSSNVVVIAIIGVFNVTLWIVERFIPCHVELLAMSYVLNEVILLMIYQRLIKDGSLDDYTVSIKIQTEDENVKTMHIVMENQNRDELFGQRQTVELSKISTEDFLHALNDFPVETRLTEREIEVAVLLLRGMKRRDIADYLCVSEETIKTHTSHIYGKLQVNGRHDFQEKTEKILSHP